MLPEKRRVAAVGALVGVAPAFLLPGPGASSPSVVSARAVPVTSTVAAVAVQVSTRAAGATVRVRDRHGTVVGTAASAPDGKAIVPVTVPAGKRTELSISADGIRGTRHVGVRTTAEGVRHSRWLVVNQRTSIGHYAPKTLISGHGARLAPAAHHAFDRMVRAAAKDGVALWSASSYRSYEQQVRLFSSYANADGSRKAATFSARPGHSEHQTGLALDVASQSCAVRACFADTKAGRWVQKHAHSYGFIIRYPKGEQSVTGYVYEPWHLRYVGTWLSGYLASAHVKTLEQAFDLPPATPRRATS